MTRRNAQCNDPALVPLAGLEFKITDSKLYVALVTLLKKNEVKLLEQLKPGFERTIKFFFTLLCTKR